jgi:hypothetical protein
MELCEPKAKGFELLVGCNFVARDISVGIVHSNSPNCLLEGRLPPMPFHYGWFRRSLSTLFFLGDFSHRKIPKEFAWKQAKKTGNIRRIFLRGGVIL